MVEKHWIFNVPILKGISFGILIVHAMGIPLIICANQFPDFFQKTDFLKLIFYTTAIGVVNVTTLFSIGIAPLIIRGKYDYEEVELYQVAFVNLLMALIISDFYIIYHFLLSLRIVEGLLYIKILLFTMLGITLAQVIIKRKTTKVSNR